MTCCLSGWRRERAGVRASGDRYDRVPSVRCRARGDGGAALPGPPHSVRVGPLPLRADRAPAVIAVVYALAIDAVLAGAYLYLTFRRPRPRRRRTDPL